MHSRYDIYVEAYAKQICIEALVGVDMVKKQFIPAVAEYATFLAESIASFKAVSVAAPVQEDLLRKVAALLASAYKNLGNLEAATAMAQEIADTVKKAEAYRDKVATALHRLRTDIDALEMIVPRELWPVPTYAELLFKL
jgi:glutamine synthetase